jgi:hypothetical protein
MPEETLSTSLEKQPSNWTKHKVGAFWIKTKEGGGSYLSGKIEIDGKETPCLIFKNDYQEGNTPHFHIYTISQP